MSKSKLSFSAIPNNFFASVPAGTYNYPQSLSFDNSGRITQISTSNGFTNGVYLAPTGGLGITGTYYTGAVYTGSVVISLATWTNTISVNTTYNSIREINVNQFGFITGTTTATIFSTGTAITSPTRWTINSTGAFTNIETGTESVNLSNVVFKTTTITGTTTIVSGTKSSIYIGSSFSPIFDVSTSTVFYNSLVLFSTGTWSMGFINVPTYTNRTTTVTVVNTVKGNAPSYTANLNITNSVSVNSVTTPVRWVNGTYPSPRKSALSGSNFDFSIYTFTMIYTGTAFLVNASILSYPAAEIFN